MENTKTTDVTYGTNGSNGYRSDSHSTTTTGKQTLSSSPPAIKDKPAPLPEPTEQGVSTAFSQFGQLIQASRRPLPTQHGDGTYGTRTKKGSIKKDLKYIGWKGKSKCPPPQKKTKKPTVITLPH